AAPGSRNLRVLDSHDLETLELLFQVGSIPAGGRMCARHRQAEPIEHRAERGRRHVVVPAGRFDFLVTHGLDLFHDSLVVSRELITHRVQFQTDLVLPVRGPHLGEYLVEACRSESCPPAGREVPHEFATASECGRNDVSHESSPRARWYPRDPVGTRPGRAVGDWLVLIGYCRLLVVEG